jgi:hypothetical protein
MAEQVITLVKIPIKEIEEWIRTKHILPSILSDFRLEEKNLVLFFNEEELPEKETESSLPKARTRRRARKKRNRMKTRGWEVAARITNSKGQKCTIYKPFVVALQDPDLSLDEQRKRVEAILRANRNRPSENSILYFLDNTLEYLKGGQVK